MLYYVRFAGIKYPMESSFTPKSKELVLCKINGEHFVGLVEAKIHTEIESKGKILRPIYDSEKEKLKEMRKAENQAYQFCNEAIKQHNLPMKLVGVNKEWEGKRYKFYFLANKRVDFRELVRDLKDKFGVTIELRHIGIRDYAGCLGGVGLCGRDLCCGTFLREKQSIQLEAARDQDIYVNPSKISGPCGRLLCCLAYEHEFYKKAQEEFPDRGEKIMTERGTSTVLHRNIIKKVLTISYEDETQEEITLSELRRKGEKWVKITKQK